ncbi:uncharacterized protein N7511_001754 [Penicillium nucicola]|uniref:uncharacterized protein n=1 Tax=Penicillium nucicola TaxID=1850975 RepID=UPI00254507C7|nr:uncharacterized protein N7511_001754 [Penicillium nucicola]KAJ5776743.1 hypothetical protein N7511_001754 [Penicillium nucicola]
MVKQLANPIPENQLLNEVREIYDELVIAERECINVVDIVSQIDQTAGLSDEQWSLCTSLHRTLLHKHFDFFIVSQYPAASPILRSLAQRYEMPGRMWRYGIYSYLELLHKRLPSVQEHILSFIYFSYSMVTLLQEHFSAFEETWTECLGDLARYRAAVENSDETVRRHWLNVSRDGYNQNIDQLSRTGQIQHYLAVISRPDTLQMFFYFSKALLSVDRFPKARESMIQLFNDTLSAPAEEHTLVTSFVAAHGVIFKRMPYDQFVTRSKFFLLKLLRETRRSGVEARERTLIMCCNIAAILDYGEENGEFAMDFAHNANKSTADAYIVAKHWASALTPIESNIYLYPNYSSVFAFRSSLLTFHTLHMMFSQASEPNMHQAAHLSLAFLWCLTLHPIAMYRLEPLVPWLALANYLNTLLHPEFNIAVTEAESFPQIEDTPTQQLPEDFLIRGHRWSRLYYPVDFFKGAASEYDRPLIENPGTMFARIQRCLWLGIRIASVCLSWNSV